MAKKLTGETIAILKNCKIENNIVYLQCGQIQRVLYQEVNEALNTLCGVWNSKKGGHIFEYNPKIAIDELIRTQELPEKNPFAFFPTPLKIIDEMLYLCESELSYLQFKAEDVRCLEPSAGQAKIAKKLQEVLPLATIDTVELDPINQKYLQEEGFNPFCGSFLDFNTDYKLKYHLIVMNPPFSYKGDAFAYITHILHAYKMFEREGTLIAIAPTGFLTNKDKKSSLFREIVLSSNQDLVMLEQGAFKESNTMVQTCIIHMRENPWKTKPHQGFLNYHVWHFRLHATCSYDLSEAFKKANLYPNFEAIVRDILQQKAKENTFFPERYFREYVQILQREYENEYDSASQKESFESINEEEVLLEIRKKNKARIQRSASKKIAKSEHSLGGLFAFAS